MADEGYLIVWLMEGETVIEGPYAVVLTSTDTTYEHVVENIDAIDDFDNLSIRWEGVRTGITFTPHVSWVTLETG